MQRHTVYLSTHISILKVTIVKCYNILIKTVHETKFQISTKYLLHFQLMRERKTRYKGEIFSRYFNK